MEKGDEMVSFDVVSLFTSVPRNEAMAELKLRLERDTKLLDRTTLPIEIIDLINMCLNDTYFQLGEKFYEQTLGLAMGSPLSPILADLYMERMEQRIKHEDTQGCIKFWRRYVDDNFAVIRRGGDPLVILERFNRISETVKLILEREKNNCLPFLDVKIMRKYDKLTTSVYRKATDSGRYLHFKSNHPRPVKVGVASCLLQRAETHCNEEQEKQKEISHVKSTLTNNGYPKNVLEK
jgi:hypothetical protein